MPSLPRHCRRTERFKTWTATRATCRAPSSTRTKCSSRRRSTVGLIAFLERFSSLFQLTINIYLFLYLFTPLRRKFRCRDDLLNALLSIRTKTSERRQRGRTGGTSPIRGAGGSDARRPTTTSEDSLKRENPISTRPTAIGRDATRSSKHRRSSSRSVVIDFVTIIFSSSVQIFLFVIILKVEIIEVTTVGT